ncbi:MAG: enoyl-CoA hydratase/isomerase [Pseudomonadota bacterium]
MAEAAVTTVDGLERVTLEIDAQGIATLAFNHPEVMNAVGAQMLADLTEAVHRIRDPEAGVRCLLITGTGRGFCAGANLQDRGRAERKGGAGDGLRSGYHPLLLALRDLEVPIVTAVNGAAAGVGMSFAILGDIVCASKQAYFLQAFAKIGLVPDGGSTYMLPRLVGWGRAMELSLLAERLPADEAQSWGLVNRVFDDNDALMAGAREIAGRLAAGPRSLGLIRRLYWQSWNNSFEQQLDLEAQMQNVAGATVDHKEGVKAFLEKRDARFEGR